MEKNTAVRTFTKAFARKKERGHEKVFVAVDIHETILKPNYGGISSEFYDYAVSVLRYLTVRKDIVLIMWTCSRKEDCKIYDKLFRSERIIFDYVNDNPEVKEKMGWGDYDSKMYVSVGLDDKYGFEAEEDWEALYEYFDLELLKF